MTGAPKHPALKRMMLLLILQLALGLLAVSAEGATYAVNTTSDLALGSGGTCPSSNACSLRAAIQTANNEASNAKTADTINLPAGTYALTAGELDITSDITIDGTGNPIIDGNSASRVFHVRSGVNFNLNNATVRNGLVANSVGGGIFNEGGTVNMDGVTVTANKVNNKDASASGGGGGIYSTGTMTLSNCAITGNVVDTPISSGGGGGLYNFGAKLTVTNCTFDNNHVVNTTHASDSTPGGGALQNEGLAGIGSNTAHVIVTGSTFTNNSAFLGGAVRNLFGKVDLTTTLVDSNSANFEGGGVENTGDSSVTLERSVLSNNVAQQNGGGAANLGTMNITNSAIYHNSVPGITLGGGASQGGVGGGIFNGGNDVLTIVSTTIAENSAVIGGGLYNHKEAYIKNATIYDNTASSTTVTPNGSQVYACGNKDVAGTTCSTGINDSTGVQIIHTIFVNSLIGNGSGEDNCAGDVTDLITSLGHNLETGNTCNFSASGDRNNTAPGFSSALIWNGGDIVTLFTYALGSSSLAHNAADIALCPYTDERSYQRLENPTDGCDIGAYEISTTTATKALDLALNIQYKNGNPQNGSVQTTISFIVANISSFPVSHVVLTIKIPTLSWLNVTSLGAESSSGSCTRSTDGVTCTLPTLDRFASSSFFVATTASQAGSFTVDGEVKSDGADNNRTNNLKSVTIAIPTMSGTNGGGVNNFGGSSGGGAVDWLWACGLLIPLLRRRRR